MYHQGLISFSLQGEHTKLAKHREIMLSKHRLPAKMPQVNIVATGILLSFSIMKKCSQLNKHSFVLP